MADSQSWDNLVAEFRALSQTSGLRADWHCVGNHKVEWQVIGGRDTTHFENLARRAGALLSTPTEDDSLSAWLNLLRARDKTPQGSGYGISENADGTNVPVTYGTISRVCEKSANLCIELGTEAFESERRRLSNKRMSIRAETWEHPAEGGVPAKQAGATEPSGSEPAHGQPAEVANGDRFRFDVALSFPGEYRSRVAKIASRLAETLGQDRILFDQWHRAEFARPNLDTYLPKLYHKHSRLLVFFLCEEYGESQWCGLEWRAGRDLLKRGEDDRLMFLRLDDSDILGLYSIDGYLDIAELPDEDVADAILQRVTMLGADVEGLRARPSGSTAAEPQVTMTVTRIAYTSDHRGVLVNVDLANRGREEAQVAQCTLELPSLGMTLQHAPGPQRLSVGAPWLPGAPFSLGPRKLSRGAFFFSMAAHRTGLPTEPLRAKLKIDMFLTPPLEQDVEIYSVDSLRKRERSSCEHYLTQPVWTEDGQETDEYECALCGKRFRKRDR